MLLKFEKIHNQEQLISIIKNQLDTATAELTALVETDSQIASKVAELELLLTQHPDYQSVVSDRFQHTPESTNSHTKPVTIRIEGDKLDQFTDILESATTGLDFKRTEDKVVVGIFGKEFFGAYGIKDNGIWMEYRLTEYLEALHSIDFDKILEGTDIAEITITDGYTPEELDARDSLFGSVSEQPVPSPYTPEPTPTPEEKIESPYSDKEEIAKVELAFNKIINTDPTEKVQGQEQPLQADEVPVTENTENFQKPETTETEQIFDELKSESLKERMFACANKAELEAFKAENPEKVTELWDSLSIVEKNSIQCINSVINKGAATPFDLVLWHDALGKSHKARYIGFYLESKKVGDDQRVIYLIDKQIFRVVDKLSLKMIAKKQQKPCPPELVKKLEYVLSTPEPQTTVEEDTAPTASEIAQNSFTGLVPAPKPTTGIATGNKPDSQASEQNDVVQAELNLKTETPEPEPDPKTEVEPTALLAAIEQEIKKVNNTLAFKYDTNGKSIFLEVFHGDSKVGTFEDDGDSLWTINCKDMLFHGFTEEQVDALAEIELSPKA